MTIMTRPEDEIYQDLLMDYMSPAADDGFSEAVMASIASRQKHLQRLRFMFLAIGSFVGGIIAATQINTVLALIAKAKLPTDVMTVATFAALFAFIVWATLDSKAEGAF